MHTEHGHFRVEIASSKRAAAARVRIVMGLVRVFVAICAMAAVSLPAWAQPGAQGGRGGGVAGPQGRPIPPRGQMPAEAPRGTAIIRGSVVAADNGSPVRHAQVRVSGQRVSARGPRPRMLRADSKSASSRPAATR